MSKKLVFLISTILLSVGIASESLAATATEGGIWPGRNPTVQVDQSSTYYRDRWNQAMGNWIASSIVMPHSGANGSFTAGVTNNYESGWDGITYYQIINGRFQYAYCYINTYYTNQGKYTTDRINGIATHEMGHALGLGHSNHGEVSVMEPYTYNSNGTVSRVYSTPQSQDIGVMNAIYSGVGTYSYVSSVMEEVASSEKSNVIIESPSWSIGFQNIDELTSYADLIVEGKVSSENRYRNLDKSNYLSYYTDSDFTINNIVKGEKELLGKTISITQMGGKSEETEVISTDTTRLEKDKTVLLFLKKNGNTYTPINENQSVFNNNGFKKYVNEKSREEINVDSVKNKVK